MIQFLIPFILVSHVSAKFEEARNSYAEKNANIVLLMFNAEKHYTLFKPNLHELIGYYTKIESHLPAHLKKQVANRKSIYSAVMKSASPKTSSYALAQKILAIKGTSSNPQEDYDILALAAIEAHFQDQPAAKFDEAPWLFRLNLRQRVFPEYEFAVIPDYLKAHPSGTQAKNKAQYMNEFLNSDYRPMSKSPDFPDLDVETIKKLIQKII